MRAVSIKPKAQLDSKQKKTALTDEELLALPKVGPIEAARYLQNGTTAQDIRVSAQNGHCPFCEAIRGKGRYTYRVNIGKLMRYKAGELE